MCRMPEKQLSGPVKIIIRSSRRESTSTASKIKFQTLNLPSVQQACAHTSLEKVHVHQTLCSMEASYPFIYFQVVRDVLESTGRQSFFDKASGICSSFWTKWPADIFAKLLTKKLWAPICWLNQNKAFQVHTRVRWNVVKHRNEKC